MPFASTDGGDIFYEVSGPADAPVVTFVEGLSYGTWMWRWQRDALDDEFRTVVFDNRGTGESDEPPGPYTVSEMAGDLEAVLDDAGIERTHVVGASLGGMIAQEYALTSDRVASLVLVCTTPGGEDAVPIPDETLDKMLNVPDDYGPAERIRYKMQPAFTDEFWAENPDLIDQIVEWRLETDPSERAYQWQSAAATTFDASDRLDELDLPTTVVHGTADRVVPFENGELLAAGIPDAEIQSVDGGPHLVFIERPERVTAAIRETVTDV